MEMLGNVLGITGMICFLGAYFLLQKGRWGAHSLPYLGANLAGSILLMLSLVIDWNLSAFLLEAAWCLISMYGLHKLYQSRRQ